MQKSILRQSVAMRPFELGDIAYIVGGILVLIGAGMMASGGAFGAFHTLSCA